MKSLSPSRKSVRCMATGAVKTMTLTAAAMRVTT